MSNPTSALGAINTKLPGIGVFGTGPSVRVLVPILREHGFRVEALWSARAPDASETARALRIPFHTSNVDDVLLRPDVQLLFVLCAPALHAQISVKALGIGKHIVCDRPAGLGQPDALKMCRAGQYYPTLIAIVNHTCRFLPAFCRLRQALNEDNYLGAPVKLIDIRVQCGARLGTDGTVYDWQCDDAMGGGALNLIGSQIIDLVTFLTNKRAIRVHGCLRTCRPTTDAVQGIRRITAPDFCTFQLELESTNHNDDDYENATGHILVTVTIHSHMPAVAGSVYQQEVIVASEKRHLIVRNGDLFGQTAASGKEEVLYLDVEDLKATTAASSHVPRIYQKGMYKMVGALREAFLPARTLSSSAATLSPQSAAGADHTVNWHKDPVGTAAGFEDALYVQAVIAAVRRSAQCRQWVPVRMLTESPDAHALISAAVRKTPIFI